MTGPVQGWSTRVQQRPPRWLGQRAVGFPAVRCLAGSTMRRIVYIETSIRSYFHDERAEPEMVARRSATSGA